MNNRLAPPKQVAIFNSLKRFVAVSKSVTATAKLLGGSSVSVVEAMQGKTITCKSHYFRPYNAQILQTDNPPNLLEYDRLLGLEMPYYLTGDVSRLGTKCKKGDLSHSKAV